MKARWGQNFLVNEYKAKKIVDSLDIKSRDKILEIGGGKGILTKFLLKAEEVIVVEIDKKLSEYLKEKFKDFGNVKILNCDFLKPDKILKNIFETATNYKVIGNIPYNITSPILKILTIYDFFNVAVLTVQKEVAERMFADGGSNFSKLTVQMQIFFDLKKLFSIKKENFYPVPEVDSWTIMLKKKKKYFSGEKRELWEKFLRTVFSSKRKYIKNTLCRFTDRWRMVLKKAGIREDLRPEELKVSDYIKIFDIIEKYEKDSCCFSS